MSDRNKKLTVGIFVDGDFIPSYSGAKNRMQYLSRYLQKIGLNIVVFHNYRGWSDLRSISKEPFKTYILPPERYYHDINLIASLLNKEGVRIIQFCDLESTIAQGVALSQSTRAYLVSELHYPVSQLAEHLGASVERIKSIRKLESTVGRVVDHVISLTRQDNRELQRRLGITPYRISTILSGVDIEEIRYSGPNFTAKTILFLGNLYFEPNAEAVWLIRHHVYPSLAQKGFKILIVGDYPPKMKLRLQTPSFVFTGPVKNLNEIFRKTTIAIAPVLEGVGLRIKILNYLAAGVPTIATSAALTGLPRTHAIVVENQIKKYPRIITDLFSDRTRALHLAREGRKFVEHNLAWATIAQHTAAVYEKIVTRKVREKGRFSDLVKNIKIGKPDWLEEFDRKRRFNKLHPQIRGDFFYGVLHQGRINFIRL